MEGTRFFYLRGHSVYIPMCTGHWNIPKEGLSFYHYLHTVLRDWAGVLSWGFLAPYMIIGWRQRNNSVAIISFLSCLRATIILPFCIDLWSKQTSLQSTRSRQILLLVIVSYCFSAVGISHRVLQHTIYVDVLILMLAQTFCQRKMERVSPLSHCTHSWLV